MRKVSILFAESAVGPLGLADGLASARFAFEAAMAAAEPRSVLLLGVGLLLAVAARGVLRAGTARHRGPRRRRWLLAE